MNKIIIQIVSKIMINISKSGNAIKFAFTDSDHYLYGNGEIEVPVNSLSLIVDESNMVTFRKANSNDIFLSFDPANSNLSDKAGVINFYKTNMVGSTGGGGSESGITSGDVQTMIDNSLVDYYTDDEVDAALSGKADTSAVTAVNDALTAHTSDTGIHVTQADKTSWNAKAEPYSAGTGIEISGNVISATGGGGATYSAGTNISIDTANTINCTLPISAGTGQNSLSIGNNGYGVSQVSGNYAVSVNGGAWHPNTVRGNNSFAANMDNQAIGEGSFANGQICIANGKFSHAEGAGCTANTYSSHAEGCYVITNNNYEHSQGKYNVSNSGSTESGQTLFSVGNGTSNSARHNAFEIRQNGDIYVNDGTNDVRLQDTILALGGLKLVKLSQSEYDALATKDANTLYIISNVVS